jgi:hypothetical protein
LPALGAALIGSKPKENKAKFGRGAIPIPKGVDEQITSRFSPAVTSKSALEQQGPYVVQGQKASDLEWRVYRMLRLLGWTDRSIQFQTAILGGRRPGGQVMDYVLYGPGQVYVIQVNGDYWHAVGVKADETKRNEAIIQAEMPSARVYGLFNADLLTDEIALATLTRLIGRGT